MIFKLLQLRIIENEYELKKSRSKTNLLKNKTSNPT